MEDVVLVAAARTPFGKLGGGLSTLSAPELGASVIKEVLGRAHVDGADIDQVIMGTVITAGIGQIPARQAAIKAGVPTSVPAFTVNKVCASSLKAVNLAALLILGENAYGMTVHEQVEKLAAGVRTVSLGSVYTTLDRLEQKGYVKSWFGGATEERGGRSKRYFKITAAGARAGARGLAARARARSAPTR